MAYPILGTPKPQFFDSNGSPLASGTITTTDPDDSSNKGSYPTAADADADTNQNSATITLDSRGESSAEFWGRDGEDYKVVLKDSSGSTIWTIAETRLPIGTTSVSKVKTADESLITATLQVDDHLTGWVVLPATYYSIEGYLLVTADAASRDLDMKFQFTNAPQDSSYTYIAVDATTAKTVDEGEVQAATATVSDVDIDGTADVGVIIRGFIFTHATSSASIDFMTAQGTDAGTTTVKKGSWIKIEPLVV